MSGSNKRMNPATAAFFQSSTWRLLFALDVLCAVGGAFAWVATHNLLSFAPLAIVGLYLSYRFYRLARTGSPPGRSNDLVQ